MMSSFELNVVSRPLKYSLFGCRQQLASEANQGNMIHITGEK